MLFLASSRGDRSLNLNASAVFGGAPLRVPFGASQRTTYFAAFSVGETDPRRTRITNERIQPFVPCATSEVGYLQHHN
ncbi:hypothetical protein U9M48_032429 [Paspalum notatum var. saurae]|uniref:Uncharacterized protein n=1 Tax=Paspalum notatum var. saurae TaxID=547442 RepID=A0AAQ3U7S4_PASNO